MTYAATLPRPLTRRILPPAYMTFFSTAGAITFLAGAAVPTPLYLHYQSAFRLTPGMLTFIFACYAFSLLSALLTAGSLSDYVGRRPVILTALLFNLASMLIFASADSAIALITARMLQGFGTGLATTSLGAAILDTDPKRGPFLNGFTAFLGLFLGALGSGLLVNFGPAPTVLVYVILGILTLLEAILLYWMPETACPRPGALRSLLPVIRLPRTLRPRFIQISPANIAAWALGGLNFSLMPSLVHLASENASPLTGSLVVATLMAGAMLAVASLRPVAASNVLRLGAVGLVIGMTLTLTAILTSIVAFMFAGIFLAGVGFGASFSGAMRDLLPRANIQDRAGLLSVVYIESYLAFGLPVIAAGIAIPHFGLLSTAFLYSSGVIVLSAASAVFMSLQCRIK